MLVYCVIEVPEGIKKQIEEESKTIFNDHKEFLWYDPKYYAIELYVWHDMEDDLVVPLQSKIEDLVGGERPFHLYGLKYAVKIGNHIDIQLDIQDDKSYRNIVKSMSGYFQPDADPQILAHIALARYKIPSKQQYSHLKNQLAKISTNVEIPVDNLTLMKVTQFGNGLKTYEKISSISLIA